MDYSIEKALELIPQSAMRHCYVTDSPGYNAAWDYHITRDGRHFIPCCAEGEFPEYVRLYEYHPKTNTLELKFKLDDKITVYPRTIRPSKFHTSMNDLPDGRIVMTTHTTASAPTHYTWMPEAYYDHMWEGFMGSNVLIYDPRTNEVEDLGIPVPRESIYGAKYIESLNALFFITYYRGHAYLFDLETRNVTDFGQCTEFGSYYLTEGPDGNIYFSSRSGDIWRFNVKSVSVEYTGAEIPRLDPKMVQGRNIMNYSANGPDGKIYFVTHMSYRFFSFDPRTGKIETLCKTLVPGVRQSENDTDMVFGMVFDDDGKMWYTSTSNIAKFPLRLSRVDITKPGAEPEDFGCIGTPDRSHVCIENIFLKDGVLYMADANGPYAPGVAAIDLSEVIKHRDDPRELVQDPHCFHINKVPQYEEHYHGDIPLTPENLVTIDDKTGYLMKEYAKNNPFSFYREKPHYVTKLWKSIGDRGSAVKALEYDSRGALIAYCDSGLAVKIEDHKVTSFEMADAPTRETDETIANRFQGYKLPHHPGRQYLAKASAYAQLLGGETLVGTRDGMLALIKDGRVFSLGAVCNDGRVHAIAASPDGRFAVGVAGDPSSLGIVFTYNIDTGVELSGFTYYTAGCYGRETCGVSCEPTTVAFSPDGKKFAIGVRDRLGCVYEYEL